MARDKANKAAKSATIKPQSTYPPAKTLDVKGKGKSTAGISDALRKAVIDLGGDEEDLELIAGVDSDDDGQEADGPAGPSKQGSDVSFRQLACCNAPPLTKSRRTSRRLWATL